MMPPLRRTRTTRPFAFVLLLLAAGLRANDPDVLRLGLSYAMLSGVNESDARASLRGLCTIISRERNIPAELDPHLYDGTSAAARALQSGEINAIGITVLEYWLLHREIDFGAHVIGRRADDPTETYLVLAHRDSDLVTVDDLRQRRLALTGGPRMCLAGIWLDLALSHRGQPPVAALVDRTVHYPKPAKAVLAVFFRQIDACLVSRRMFETMSENNPQVGAELRVLAASPAFVPALFVVGHRMSPPFRERLVREFEALHTSAAGQQVLTIFQMDRIVAQPAGTLQPSLALLDEYARVYPGASTALVAAVSDPRTAIAPPP